MAPFPIGALLEVVGLLSLVHILVKTLVVPSWRELHVRHVRRRLRVSADVARTAYHDPGLPRLLPRAARRRPGAAPGPRALDFSALQDLSAPHRRVDVDDTARIARVIGVTLRKDGADD